MSTDRRGTRRGRGAIRGIALAVLAVLAVALGWANLAQAPRIETSDANPELLVTRPAQRVTINLNQPVASVESQDLEIEPEVPVEVTSDGSAVTLAFPEMLDYGAHYRISIDVRGAFTGVSGSVSTELDTPDPLVYTLARSDSGDRVLEHRLIDATHSRTVLQAPHIQEYAAVDQGRLLAITLADDQGAGTGGRATLSYYAQQEDGADDPLSDLYEIDSLEQLSSEERSGKAGVIATGTGIDGKTYDHTLFLFDTATDAAPFTQVVGPDGSPLRVADWAFVPGTTATVMLGVDGELYLHQYVPTDQTVALGKADELLGFMPGSSTLALSTGGTTETLDLSEAQFTAAQDLPAREPAKVATQAARRDPESGSPLPVLRSAAQAITLSSDGLGVQLIDGSETAGDPETLFAPASTESRVGRVCLSPNGEYLSVETVSAEGEPDGYPGAPGYSHTTTHFVRIDGASGASNPAAMADRSAIGSLSSWCG